MNMTGEKHIQHSGFGEARTASTLPRLGVVEKQVKRAKPLVEPGQASTVVSKMELPRGDMVGGGPSISTVHENGSGGLDTSRSGANDQPQGFKCNTCSDVFASFVKLDDHAQLAHDRKVCRRCLRNFKGDRGVAGHMRKAHAVWYHNMLEAKHQPRRRRWTEDEWNLVANHEVRLLEKGWDPRDITSDIRRTFTERSAYALKGMRRQERHKDLVREIARKRDLSRKKEVDDLLEELVSTIETREKEARDKETVREDTVNKSAIISVSRQYECFKRENHLTGNKVPSKQERGDLLDLGLISGNRRKRRSILRAAWLTAYEKNPKRTARRILEGKQLSAKADLPDGFASYWTEVFSGAIYNPLPFKVRDDGKYRGLTRTITCLEVKRQLKAMSDTASGIDGIRLGMLRKIKLGELAKLFNSFLVLRKIPKDLKKFRTTLIPKVKEPTKPWELRPISIGSVMRRAFSGILARRLKQVQTHYCQRGFKSEEGCAINVMALRQAVGNAIRDGKTLSYAFIDVAKAFDSVKHSQLRRAYQSAGLPSDFIELLENMYCGSSTTFCDGSKARIRRGVLQGDPLSPLIFNLVLDDVLKGLNENTPVSWGDSPTQCLLFADDAVLLARTPEGLQGKVNNFVTRLSRYGLKVNPDKCAAVHLKADRKRKRYYVSAKTKTWIDGRSIKSLLVGESYRYLGIRLDSQGNSEPYDTGLSTQLERLTKSYLKPLQRLEVLKRNVIPSIQYRLDIGGSTGKMLRGFDMEVRRYLRRWLHLPKDVANAFFYASTKDGGLGVPCLKTRVPRLQYNRWQRMRNIERPDPVVRALVKEWDKEGSGQGKGPKTINEERELWRARLYCKVDGVGLRTFPDAWTGRSSWLTASKPKLSGKEGCRLVQLRAGSLWSRSRAARGREGQNPACKSCPDRRGTLDHLLQKCSRTHGLRLERHALVVRRLVGGLKRCGFGEILEEPIIPMGNSFVKPDIVAFRARDRRAVVLDPTIVGHTTSLVGAWNGKRKRYECPAVIAWIRARFGLTSKEKVFVSGVVISWRGAMCLETAGALAAIGLRANFAEFLIFTAMKFSAYMWARDHCRTD